MHKSKGLRSDAKGLGADRPERAPIEMRRHITIRDKMNEAYKRLRSKFYLARAALNQIQSNIDLIKNAACTNAVSGV